MELSWIDDKGDTIKINGNPKIWNINATYVMVSTETPINYKPSFDEDGNLLPDEMPYGGYSYLINKNKAGI